MKFESEIGFTDAVASNLGDWEAVHFPSNEHCREEEKIEVDTVTHHSFAMDCREEDFSLFAKVSG
ncbi:hypothetical protein OAK50_00735 [Verrucomicrobiales bacterium]|jgi:hypothetical protein|nr:hypothetical protein [Verrucomicrobiales bacterium]MDA9922647.1 hypothetical protein [Verrucomicrobiales bacterium]MDB2497278.1 hypothetical protein [Verrucomicrobiales bacterium]MDB2642454.1 hypothetical protein [bacterium]MDC0262795.1 hypothetical protein [Verrucomicrobiales bacterium]